MYIVPNENGKVSEHIRYPSVSGVNCYFFFLNFGDSCYVPRSEFLSTQQPLHILPGEWRALSCLIDLAFERTGAEEENLTGLRFRCWELIGNTPMLRLAFVTPHPHRDVVAAVAVVPLWSVQHPPPD